MADVDPSAFDRAVAAVFGLHMVRRYRAVAG